MGGSGSVQDCSPWLGLERFRHRAFRGLVYLEADTIKSTRSSGPGSKCTRVGQWVERVATLAEIKRGYSFPGNAVETCPPASFWTDGRESRNHPNAFLVRHSNPKSGRAVRNQDLFARSIPFTEIPCLNFASCVTVKTGSCGEQISCEVRNCLNLRVCVTCVETAFLAF